MLYFRNNTVNEQNTLSGIGNYWNGYWLPKKYYNSCYHQKEKDIKLSLKPFQASAIKEVLLMLPTEIPTNEQNELRQMLWKLDQELLEC